MRPPFTRLVLASLTLLACNTNPESATKDAPVVAGKTDAESKTPPAADAKVAQPPPSTETKTAGDPATPPSGDVKAEDAKAEDTKTDAAAATAGEAPPPAVDPAAAAEAKKKLLDEAKAKKTSDTRAKKALEEAEKGGATVREVAEAANARGEALFDEPERAAAFFTWAKDKDTTYPNPVFNLAKQSANAGDTAPTVELLKEVSKRGGKTLLKQVGFDPTFEIVKDDAEVQKLIK
ncbi:hypothetical protein [Nannocystis punicea]|uniref:Lipoprotein n=1 Tax=Nannocystis punicea TaxID=2995304 RepID=A0ABY7H2C8_9BACT|nr:hypothetical protein [Nannocystis poenicansa]WAS93401.1 hypothetical protein O0S08_45230 [Nannocystis poenicansa]